MPEQIMLFGCISRLELNTYYRDKNGLGNKEFYKMDEIHGSPVKLDISITDGINKQSHTIENYNGEKITMNIAEWNIESEKNRSTLKTIKKPEYQLEIKITRYYDIKSNNNDDNDSDSDNNSDDNDSDDSDNDNEDHQIKEEYVLRTLRTMFNKADDNMIILDSWAIPKLNPNCKIWYVGLMTRCNERYSTDYSTYVSEYPIQESS